MNTTLSTRDLLDLTVARIVSLRLKEDIAILLTMAERLQAEVYAIAYDEAGETYDRERLGDFHAWSDFHADKVSEVSRSLMALRLLIQDNESAITLRKEAS